MAVASPSAAVRYNYASPSHNVSSQKLSTLKCLILDVMLTVPHSHFLPAVAMEGGNKNNPDSVMFHFSGAHREYLKSVA